MMTSTAAATSGRADGDHRAAKGGELAAGSASVADDREATLQECSWAIGRSHLAQA